MTDQPSQQAIAAACDEISRRIQAGEDDVAQSFLKEHAEFQRDHESALEIIYTEIQAREGRGESPGMQSYVEAYPYLAERLSRLFQLHSAFEPDELADESSSAFEDSVVNYKLVREIGQGGMGVVYLAEQLLPIQRNVAVKIIRPGMDSQQIVDRFEAERQALAIMDHPNIAQVFDAGTTYSGRPYFAMELVSGQPITEFCDTNQLTPQERIELFVPICQAIQHAHQKGIIHRDIKPSNILITQQDGRAVPKIIDFGVAKATQGGLTQRAAQTSIGQIVGTLEYMSPEQAEFNQTDIDTRSDIYSLGIVLYELLTGTTPFSKEILQRHGIEEMLRTIRENDPPTPSDRLSESGERLASISAVRNTEPQKLSGILRGELDWIIMKALEKDRARRYDSANQLADDVKRYLNGEAVLACPPTISYRFRKFAARNKAFIATLTAISIILITATTISLIMTVRAWAAEKQQREAKKAETEKRILAEDTLEYLVEAFRSPEPERDGRTVTIAEILDRAVQDLEDRFEDAPETKAALLEAFAKSYLGLGLVDKSSAVWQQLHDMQSEKMPDDEKRSLAYRYNLALSHEYAGRLSEAISQYERLLPQMQKEAGKEHHQTLVIMHNLANCFHEAGRIKQSLELHEKVLSIKEKQPHFEDVDFATYADGYGLALQTAGRLEESVDWHQRALNIQKAKLGEKDPGTLMTMSNLSAAMHSLGRTEESVELQQRTLELRREVLGPSHFETLQSLNNLAYCYHVAGDLEKALPLYEESLELKKKSLPADHPSLFRAMHNVAAVYESTDRLDDALKLYQETHQKKNNKLGEDHPDSLATTHNLGRLLNKLGKSDEGMQLLERCLKLHLEKLGPDHMASIKCAYTLASGYLNVGQQAEANELFHKTLEIANEKLGTDHPLTKAINHRLKQLGDEVANSNEE